MALMTWIIPAGQYEKNESGNLISGTYHEVEPNKQGLYEVMMAPVYGMLGKDTTLVQSNGEVIHVHTNGAIQVSFFILMVGGFLGVVSETGALDIGIASVVKKHKGKEKRLIPILMILFALGGTTYGMAEETMAFYPLLIPVMLVVGFDTITAVAIILIGSQIGCLASTVNPFSTGVASDVANIGIAEGMGVRIVFFVVMLAIAIPYVYRYASKVEKDPSASLVFQDREKNLEFFQLKATDTNLTKVQKKVLRIFAFTFVIMVIALVPWSSDSFHVTIFEELNTSLTSLPVIGTIFGHSLALGDWYFPEITMLFLMMAILVGFVSKMDEKRFIEVFMQGVADLLKVSLICAIARGIQVIMNDGLITATILHFGEESLANLPSSVFITLTYLFYLPLSFLIPSTSGLAGATIGIMAPLGEFAGVSKHLVITAFQSASGILNLLSPTSGIVMGALALGHVDLTTWWKFIGKLALMILLATIGILVLATILV